MLETRAEQFEAEMPGAGSACISRTSGTPPRTARRWGSRTSGNSSRGSPRRILHEPGWEDLLSLWKDQGS